MRSVVGLALWLRFHRSVEDTLAANNSKKKKSKPSKASPPGLEELPLAQCEHHCVVTDEHDLIIIDDVRRSAVAHQRAAMHTRWASKVADQGVLAGAGMLELGRQVLRHGSASLQATLVHVATNSIQYFWTKDPHGHGALQQLPCTAACDQLRTLEHITECMLDRSIIEFRKRLQQSVCSALSEDACTRGWLATHQHLALRALLLALFPAPASASADEQRRHLALLMVGAFTPPQATAASKLLGFATAKDGRQCLLRLRLRCLESIEKAYRNWKEVALRA